MATKSIRLSNGTDTLLPEAATHEQTNLGQYVKFADGTLIQWAGDTIAAGNSKLTATFPQPFINSNYAIMAIPVFSQTRIVSCVFAAQTTTSVDLYRSSSDLTQDQYIRWLAIGRWK